MRPDVTRHTKAPTSPDDDDQGTIDLGRNAVRVKSANVKKLDEIVAKHPDEALNVVRNWLHQES